VAVAAVVVVDSAAVVVSVVVVADSAAVAAVAVPGGAGRLGAMGKGVTAKAATSSLRRSYSSIDPPRS
jgi:hypothetical protein